MEKAGKEQKQMEVRKVPFLSGPSLTAALL